MPTGGDDPQCPCREAEGGGGHIDVAMARERRLMHGAVGVDLDNLLARHPGDDVEVVDGEIAPDPA